MGWFMHERILFLQIYTERSRIKIHFTVSIGVLGMQRSQSNVNLYDGCDSDDISWIAWVAPEGERIKLMRVEDTVSGEFCGYFWHTD